MSVFNEFPYTNMHELNLDWILAKVKELATEWLQVHTEFETMQQLVNGLEEYVHDYFENLDVQDEINVKIDDMADDGSLMALINPSLTAIIDPYMRAIVTAWLNTNITNPSNPPLDTTLTLTGAAADARATGNRFAPIENIIYVVPTGDNLADPDTMSQGMLLQDGSLDTSATYITTDFIELEQISGQVWRWQLFNLDKETKPPTGTVTTATLCYDQYKSPIGASYENIAQSGDTINASLYKYIRISMPIGYELLVEHKPGPPLPVSVWADYASELLMMGRLGQNALDQIAAYFGLTPVNP